MGWLWATSVLKSRRPSFPRLGLSWVFDLETAIRFRPASVHGPGYSLAGRPILPVRLLFGFSYTSRAGPPWRQSGVDTASNPRQSSSSASIRPIDGRLQWRHQPGTSVYRTDEGPTRCMECTPGKPFAGPHQSAQQYLYDHPHRPVSSIWRCG